MEVGYGAGRTFPFCIFFYKGGEEVRDNIGSSKAGNESQTETLFWSHVPASKLLKPSMGKGETEGWGWMYESS